MPEHAEGVPPLSTAVCKHCGELIYEKRGDEGLNVKTGEWQKTIPWRLWVHASDGVVVCGFNPVQCAAPQKRPEP